MPTPTSPDPAPPESTGPPRLVRTPIVIAPDVILDFLFKDGRRAVAAVMLFDAIGGDLEAGIDERPAYIAPVTLPAVARETEKAWGSVVAHMLTTDFLRLLMVVPLVNDDYYEAIRFAQFGYENALQFVACRRVGAKYLVTGDRSVKRAPVQRRTAAEMLPFLRKG